MNNKIMTPLIVPKNEFNKEFIENLNDEKYIKIIGNYKLTKKDYDNLLLYSNVQTIEVQDTEMFEYQEDLKVITEGIVEFKTNQFKKIKINKSEKYNKTSLTLTLPFKIDFENDCLSSEEEEFNLLLKYIDNLELLNINMEDTNQIDNVINLIYKIEKKIGKKIQFINCITKNQTIETIEKLKFLEDDRIIKIWYEDGITDCSVDEFIIMRKNIDAIKKQIETKELSDFEKVIYIYDIVKKYKYNKSEDDYSMDGRQLHKIFNTKNIICSGYARIISEVLNELGIRAGIYKLITNNNELHARNLVHIKDEKYNINCIYSMEPTWESAIKEDYAYSLFLTPVTKLKEYFPNESFRQDIDVLCGVKNINEIELRDRISLYQFFENKDLTQEEINNVISTATKKATLKDFCNALINVKVSEGQSRNAINVNIKNIINYNTELTNYLNKKIKTNINFFEWEVKNEK